MSEGNGEGGSQGKLREAVSKLGDSRVGKEMEFVASVAATGSVRFVIPVFVHLILTWCAVVLVVGAFLWLMPPPSCAVECLGGVYEKSCCARDPHFVISAILFLAVTFSASFVSTKCTPKNRYRHSSLLSAFFLVTLVGFFIFTGMSISRIVSVLVLVFFAMFGGYRLALWK